MKGISGLNGFVGFEDKNIYISDPKTIARAGICYLTIDSRGVIWAAQYNGELWISTNDGFNFTNSNNNFSTIEHHTSAGHYSISVDTQDRLYSINSETGVLYRGTININNNDVTWESFDHSEKLYISPSAKPNDIFFDIFDNMYITCIDGRIFKSTDCGETLDNGNDVTAAWYKGNSDSEGNLYIISKTQLFKSSDGGNSFDVVYNFSSLYINNFTIDENDTIFVAEFIDNISHPGVWAKVYSSYDKGISFDSGTIITTLINNRFYGICSPSANNLVITTSPQSGNSYSVVANYSNILNLEISDKTLDNSEIVCTMNKGNDSFLPTFGLTHTRYAETQTNISILRRDITDELKRDGFTNIKVVKNELGEILIDCQHV